MAVATHVPRRRAFKIATFASVLVALLVACDAGDSSVTKTVAAPAEEVDVYTTGEVRDAGRVRVLARYKGPAPPERRAVEVTANVEHCGGKVFPEDLIVDARSGGLANVVVRLEDIVRGKEAPKEVSVVNRDCAFVPHVSVAVTGATLRATSEDPITHSTHPRFGRVSFFNWQFQGGSPESPDVFPGKTIDGTGLLTVKCDVHSWMKAYVLVHDNPYLGVTDADGELVIDWVPPGTHRYVAWHERLGERSGSLTVGPGESVSLDLSFAP